MIVYGEEFPPADRMGKKAAVGAMYRFMRNMNDRMLKRSPRVRRVAMRLVALGALTPVMAKVIGFETGV